MFLLDGEVEQARLTYAELDARARAVATALQRRGAAGVRVLLLYPAGLDFIAAFFGCLYAGAVAVPAYPPRAGREQPRLRSILEDARPRFVLAPAAVAASAARLDGLGSLLGQTEWLVTDELSLDLAGEWKEPAVGPGDLAFLQYTSGSTSEPKGVMVSHGNLIANEEVIRAACGHDEGSTFVSWLPLYHDMGLIGARAAAALHRGVLRADAAGRVPAAAGALAAGDLALPRPHQRRRRFRVRPLRPQGHPGAARGPGPLVLAHRLQRRRAGARRHAGAVRRGVRPPGLPCRGVLPLLRAGGGDPHSQRAGGRAAGRARFPGARRHTSCGGGRPDAGWWAVGYRGRRW